MRATGKSSSTSSLNPLARLGSPFFRLFVILLASLSFLILLLHKIGLSIQKKIDPNQWVSELDNLLTSLFSRNYLQQKKLGKPRPKPRKKFSFRLSPFSSSLLLILLTAAGFSLYLYFQIFRGLPSPYDLTNRSQKLTTQILDRNGQLLFKIYQEENRTPIKLTSLPPYVKQAFLAIEDNGFYQHSGFSLPAVLRATFHNLTQPGTEGGSTITQQLVKNALLTSEKTWQRKVKELILAIAVESIYNKDQILEMYLNEVGFGGPAYGIQEASQQYFGLDAKDMSLAQAAFIAGLPKAPSKYSPYIRPQLALSRQNLVLNLMLKDGYISQDQMNLAINSKLEFAPPKIEIKAPHFVMYIRDLLVDQYGEELVGHGGLRVTTTLDLTLQKQAEEVLNQELNRLAGLNVSNGSVLITKPATGEILVMVGSKNYFDIAHDGQVNLTTSLRQPGSSIKVVNYSLAFENGATPNSLINDAPISFNIAGSGIWTPKNYDGRFHGIITLRQALADSYNIPAVLMLAKNGVPNMIALGKAMGITSWTEPDRYGLSLTLGGAEVKMTDLSVVYATLANNGRMVPLNPIAKIEDRNGQLLKFDLCLVTSPCQSASVLKPETAFFINDILSDNDARAAAFGYHSVLNISPLKAAVKTGTSNDLRDNWTIGYTPDYLVAAWVGNNDNSPMNRVASGITGASPVWNRIMVSLLTNHPNNTSFSIPENLLRLPVCTLTGTLTCTGCPTRYEYFVKGNEPKSACKPEDVQKILEEKAKATPTPVNQILNGTSTIRQ